MCLMLSQKLGFGEKSVKRSDRRVREESDL